jgi:hypothetical protein
MTYRHFKKCRAKSIKLAYGYILDFLFEHCKLLSKLEVYHCILEQLNPTTKKSNSVTEVHINECFMCKDALPEISARLPEMKTLRLINPRFVTYKGTYPIQASMDLFSNIRRMFSNKIMNMQVSSFLRSKVNATLNLI